jgi:hypothetical protein
MVYLFSSSRRFTIDRRTAAPSPAPAGGAGCGAAVVKHLRLFMEFAPDPMAAEFAHDRKTQ